MKKISTYGYIFLFTLLTDFVAFAADEPGDFGDPGDDNPLDVSPAPIDGYLLWMALIAIAFAMFVISRRRAVRN